MVATLRNVTFTYRPQASLLFFAPFVLAFAVRGAPIRTKEIPNLIFFLSLSVGAAISAVDAAKGY